MEERVQRVGTSEREGKEEGGTGSTEGRGFGEGVQGRGRGRDRREEYRR